MTNTNSSKTKHLFVQVLIHRNILPLMNNSSIQKINQKQTMKSIRTISLLITFVLNSFSMFSQNVKLESLKKENSLLKTELTKTKVLLDTSKKVIFELQSELTKTRNQRDSIQLVSSKLIQDTTFLRTELQLCSLYNNGKNTETIDSNPNFKTTFLKCTGNRQTQKVELTFMIQHNLPNQDFTIHTHLGNAFDALGQTYKIYESFVGGQEGKSKIIPTNTPTKIAFVFNNFLPGNDFLKAITFHYNYMNTDFSNLKSSSSELRNIKIIWD
jgi:hypothetical protein